MDFSRAPIIAEDEPSLIVPKAIKPVYFYLLVPAVPLNPEGRRTENRSLKLERYRNKKKCRDFTRKVRYQCRKEQASKRDRVKGKFVRTDVEMLSRKTTEDEESIAQLDIGDDITKLCCEQLN